MTEQLKMVHFASQFRSRIVTQWVSGVQSNIQFERNFDALVDAVAAAFDMEGVRIYVLQSPRYEWKDKCLLTAENFDDFIERTGIFQKPKISKLYVHANTSPDSSPVGDGKKGGEKVDSSEGSQTSSRSGQGEFSEALLRRDILCVFCRRDAALEAAHIIPVDEKGVLNEPANCALYGISSINDTANGILLCRACHKCVDSNLVCINSTTGKLRISDALLSNEPEKWASLVNITVPISTVTWPSKQLLKFREDAMDAATTLRHERLFVVL
jgi:hypothetical protein